MTDNGYVKLWRKSLESPVFKNPELWYFWSWCLMKASHTHHKTLVGFQEVDLKRGQFIFGLHKASEDTKLSVQKIRTCLQILRNMKNLTIKSTNKYSIISICNWDRYQIIENNNNKQTNKSVTNKQQTSNNKQECKECKEKEKEIKTKEKEKVDDAQIGNTFLDDFKNILITVDDYKKLKNEFGDITGQALKDIDDELGRKPKKIINPPRYIRKVIENMKKERKCWDA